MTTPDTTRLARILADIDQAFDAGSTAAEVIIMLEAEHDATYTQAPTTNTLRCAGITGSCTWSQSDGVLGSWRRNAEKRLSPGIGHNRKPSATDDRLRLLIERVERLEEEKKGIADDIKEVWAEAKAVGYDVKIGKQIVRLRKMQPDARAEMEAVLETYKAALGLS